MTRPKRALSKEQQAVRDFSTWRHPWNQSPDYERTRLLFADLKKLGEKLRRQHGNNFVGIQVFGSRAKGYAEQHSDLECALVFNKHTPDADAASREIKTIANKHAINSDYHRPRFIQDMKNNQVINYEFISDLFAAGWISAPGKEKARKEVLRALEKHPGAKWVWRAASDMAGFHAYLGRRPLSLSEEAHARIRLSRSKKMRLPPLEEMNRVYLGKPGRRKWVQKEPGVFELRRRRTK